MQTNNQALISDALSHLNFLKTILRGYEWIIIEIII